MFPAMAGLILLAFAADVAGLNPKIETIAFGTLCRERDCKWQNDEWEGIPRHFGKWQSSG
jgi:hypothetical protein